MDKLKPCENKVIRHESGKRCSYSCPYYQDGAVMSICNKYNRPLEYDGNTPPLLDPECKESIIENVPDQVLNALELAKVSLMSYAAEDTISQGYGAGCRSNPDESIKVTLGVINRAIEAWNTRHQDNQTITLQSRAITEWQDKCMLLETELKRLQEQIADPTWIEVDRERLEQHLYILHTTITEDCEDPKKEVEKDITYLQGGE